MLFVIHCLDKPGVLEARRAHMPAHRDYLATNPIKLIMSGPLTSDDGSVVLGSLFLVEAEDRAEVEAFQRNDPLFQAGVWKSVDVRAFTKRVDNLGNL